MIRLLGMPRMSTHSFRPTLFAAAFLCAACGGEQVVRQAPEVTVSQPVVRPVQPYADFTGTTRSMESVEIRARVGGVLEQQLFTPSDAVEEGEVLFIIEQDQYAAAREEAAAMLRSAVADSALKESNLERIQIAIETNAVSEQDLDRALAERDAAVAGVLGARAQLARADLDYQYTTVRSPIAGQVGRRLVDLGNLVGYTERTKLTTVNQMRPIHVYFNAPEWVVLRMLRAMEAVRETEAGAAMEGDREEGVLTEEDIRAQEKVARVLIGTSADADTFPFSGHLDFIGNTVDPNTGTIELRAVFENEEMLLFPGLFVRVRVLATEPQEALLVQERAIGTDLGGKYLLLVGAENIVERRYVTLGQLQPDGTVVIEEGIEPGDTYVSNGLLRARPGLPVTPLTEEEVARREAAMAAQAGQGGEPGEEE